MQIQSPLSVGLFAGKWCSYAAAPDLPHDQREEDGGALTFDSDHLEENLEILGPPIAEFELSADQPVAMIAVRLSDIAPDDKATRITYGLLNLTHRESSEAPQPLEPGKRYRIRVQLNDVAQSFPKGHRLRLSVSTSYWPLAWPPPNPVRLTIYTGACRLFLPIRPPRLDDQRLRAFDDPEGAAPCEQTMIEPPNHNWRVIRDLAKDQSTLHVVKDEGVKQLDDIDLVVRDRIDEWYIYREDDFNSVRGETQCVRELRRDDWNTRTTTRTILTADENNFCVIADLDAWEGDRRVYANSWDCTIKRDLL